MSRLKEQYQNEIVDALMKKLIIPPCWFAIDMHPYGSPHIGGNAVSRRSNPPITGRLTGFSQAICHLRTDWSFLLWECGGNENPAV